jgi:hypothetical protein
MSEARPLQSPYLGEDVHRDIPARLPPSQSWTLVNIVDRETQFSYSLSVHDIVLTQESRQDAPMYVDIVVVAKTASAIVTISA